MNTDKRIEHTPPSNSVEDLLQWIDEDVDNAFKRVLPPHDFGENEDAALIWQIVHDAGAHLSIQRAKINEMREALKRISEENYDDDDKSRHLRATIDRMKSIAESILKKTE